MKLAVVLRDLIDVEHYISGQEYYLYTLLKVLPKFGIKVDLLSVEQLLSTDGVLDNYDSLHLYYLGFKDVIKIKKVFKKSKLVYQVYHVEDVTWTKVHELSWKAFLLSIRPLVNQYLATSRSVCSWIKSRIVGSSCVLAEPYYECNCRSFYRLAEIVFEKFYDNEIRLLYIGRLSPYRSPPMSLLTIAKNVSLSTERRVKLTIVSKLSSKKRIFRYNSGNVVVNFIDGRISDVEKCKLYRESHFFIYLARGNVAMNPPITLLEAIYHGTIPIASSWVLRDIDLPPKLIANDESEAIDKIIDLWNNQKSLAYVLAYLKKSLRRFYDVYRFVEAIKRTF